jgi:uncharacterized membrane protein (DUF485 family)
MKNSQKNISKTSKTSKTSKSIKATIAKKGGDMFNDAFAASAVVGRTMSWFGLVIGVIFSIIIIIVGVVFLKSKTYDSSTNAKITNVSCTGSGKEASCTVELVYQVNEKEVKTSTVMTGVYNVGQIIPIKYDSVNPQDMSTTTISSKIVGGILVGFGVLMFIGVCAWFYIVQTNNTIAAASGVGDIAGLVSNGVDNNDNNNNNME